MILDQVLYRKMQAISMDDTLQVALRKLRELDWVNSPIIEPFEEQALDDEVHILHGEQSLLILGQHQKQVAEIA